MKIMGQGHRGAILPQLDVSISKEGSLKLYTGMAKVKKDKERKLSLYKKDAWDAFSRFIRTRDCLATTGEPDWGKCVTCGERKPFKLLDAGHFTPGRGNSILFIENNCHAQCKKCNGFYEGERVKYEKFMIKSYGQDEVDKLERMKYTDRQFTRTELLALREYYDQKTEELQKVYREGVPPLSYEEICQR